MKKALRNEKIRDFHKIINTFLKNAMNEIKEFGVYYYLTDYFMKRINLLSPETHYKKVYSILSKELAPLIQEYKLKTNSVYISEKSDVLIPVWICWWQGEKEMPEVVKSCFESAKRMLPEQCEITLITWKNLNDYVTIPSYILDLYEEGVISLTHLSDFLRVILISKYGGFWVDSTYYFAKPISYDEINIPFYTKRNDNPKWIESVAKGRWSGNFLIGKRNDVFFEFVKDSLLLYWKNHRIQIDYLMIDYLIWIAYDNFENIKNMIDSIPYGNSECNELNGLLNKKFEEKTWNKMISNTKFFKLSYKEKMVKRTAENELTFYGFITNDRSENT